MGQMIRNLREQVLHKGWRTLKELSYELLNKKGAWKEQSREVYETGDAATILLYNKEQKTIILTRQFRLATYLNQNPEGLLTEVCAGKMDADETAEACIVREVEEETGYKVNEVKKVFEAYMGPGVITELVHFFVAPYDASMKASAGGGLEEEGEEITILELSFEEAYNMLDTGAIRDAKTLVLLQYLRLKEKELCA